MRSIERLIGVSLLGFAILGCSGATTETKENTIIKVEKPIFSLTSGVYESDIQISIFCPTTEATIYYTLDGTTPNTNSTKYNGIIDITGNNSIVIISAIAIKDNMTNSDVNIAEYTIKYKELNMYSYLYYGSNQQQIIKIDTNTGSITNIGAEKTLGSNKRGFFVNEATNELLWIYYGANFTPFISKINLVTDTVTTVQINLPADKTNMSQVCVDSSNNVYAYLYYGSNQQQIIKIDTNTGSITNIGAEKTLGSNKRGFFINEATNELLWIYYDENYTPFISKINLVTDTVTTVQINLPADKTNMSSVFFSK